jgi:murein DD-endopeptidase MepM/ murein hydrolase activator NlpD
MPTTSFVPHQPRRRSVALAVALLTGAMASAAPALAQDGSDGGETTTTTTPDTTITLPPPVGETTTTTTAPDPDDPTQGEELPAEEVPVVPDTVPPRGPEDGEYAQQAGRLIRQQLEVAQADAVGLETTYRQARDRVIFLEAGLDRLEEHVTNLADDEREAVRRVEAARRRFEARTVSAVVRGESNDLTSLIVTDDPNDIAIAETLLGSILEADDEAVRDYLEVKASVSADLVGVAERLADARLALEDARGRLVEARRANVAAQFNLAVFAAGSEIVIHGFVFPVGDPHTFGDSFGAPRMMGSQYEHAHQGTDIMAPFGTPLMACERGIITEMGTDVLGGTKLWLKGESGTYYYYAHLSAFAEGLQDGDVVEAGDVVGLVGDTGNAKGGAPHLHFEIHPDGGPAVNPYPLLKVVDELREQAKARARQ